MIKRKRIGSGRMESPSMVVKRHLSGLFAKIIFSLICGGVVYLFFNYMVFNFINFILVNISETSEIELNDPYFMTAKIFFVVCVILYVLKDNLRKR